MKDNNQSYLKNTSPKNLYKSAHPWLLCSRMRLRYSPAGNKKNLLLKTNNKQIGNEVNKVMDIAIRSLIATILFFLSHTNLRSLNQVFHCLQTKNLRCRDTLKTMAPQGFNSNNYL